VSLDIEPTGKPPLEIAKEAVAHTLKRIRDDANIGYHCGAGTQVFTLLVQAASRLFDVPVEKLQRDFAPRGREEDRDVSRHEVRALLEDIEYDLRTQLERARERADSWHGPAVTGLIEVANRLRTLLQRPLIDVPNGEYAIKESEVAA